MRVPVAVVSCWIAVFAADCAAQAPARTWITDVTIISPEQLDRIERGSVLIENDRIVRVERKKGAKAPAGATVVAGKGQFLIPGLIDSHVHVASIPGMTFPQAKARPAMIGDYLRQLPRSYLYFGYTTLIDLIVVDRPLLDRFRQAPLHPDLYDCGAPLAFANGYPMIYAPPAVRFKLFPNFIYDPQQASAIPAEFKPENHAPAADVARVKDSGAICVKTFFERGFGGQKNLPVMSADVLADVRKAASAADLILMVHANSFEAQKFAVTGGADVIAHGMWNWGDLDGNPEIPSEVKVVLDDIVQKKIGYQPTIQVMQGLRAYFDPDYLKLTNIAKVIPKAMLDWFNSPEGKWFKADIGEKDVPDATMSEGYERGPIHRVRKVVAYLAANNANFLFGTDTPSGPTYGNLPGLNGYLEMQQLEKAGMSLRQIFLAATLSNAREFKLDSQLGTIEPGKLANLVLLRKSPLESVSAYDSISRVWIRGKSAAREELAAGSNK
jgi:imidazolonepropionase-like amidohydrolase